MFAQEVRQLIGARVEFTIGPLTVGELHRDRVRGPGHLFFEKLWNRFVPWIIRAGVVPFEQELASLGHLQQRQVGKRLTRIGGNGFQQSLKMAEHPGDGLALKQVEVVFQRRAEPLGCFHQGEGQIELGSAAVHVDRLELQLRQLPRCHRRVLQHEHDLEKGIAAEGSFRLQFLHQFLERQILMSKCAERVFAYTLKQSPERRVACQVTAENHRVDEETNQVLQIQLVSACDHRADQDVFLAGVTVQKRLEGRQQSHEKGDALLTG